MSLSLSLKYERGALAAAFEGVAGPIAEAGTAAITAAADQAKAQARSSILQAGFTQSWANTLRGDVYPKSGASMDAAAAIYSRIPYADVFESGAQIRGKPMLWVPLSSTPKRVSRKKMTPKNFIDKIGPLFPIRKAGRRPILAAQMTVSKTAERRGPPYKVNLAALRRGASGADPSVAVPLFVGIPTVTIKKKFNVTGAVERAAAALPALYLANLKVD